MAVQTSAQNPTLYRGRDIAASFRVLQTEEEAELPWILYRAMLASAVGVGERDLPCETSVAECLEALGEPLGASEFLALTDTNIQVLVQRQLVVIDPSLLVHEQIEGQVEAQLLRGFLFSREPPLRATLGVTLDHEEERIEIVHSVQMHHVSDDQHRFLDWEEVLAHAHGFEHLHELKRLLVAADLLIEGTRWSWEYGRGGTWWEVTAVMEQL